MDAEMVLKAAAAERGRCALVTPIAWAGSLPTGREARMLVTAEGTCVGTVGGGRMEGEAAAVARRVAREGLPAVASFSLTAEDARTEGLLCGGRVTFLVEPVAAASRPALAAMADRTAAGSETLEAIRLPAELETWVEGPVRRLAAWEGGTAGSLGSDLLDAWAGAHQGELAATDAHGVREVDAGGKRCRLFLNALSPRPMLIIFGGGHVGLDLARAAPLIGFRVTVVDDREEFANAGRFPGADATLVLPFASCFTRLRVDGRTYVAIVTRGHASDLDVLTQALRTPARYIGMIGSRRKVARMFEAAREAGFGDGDLARVHAPIGLDIGADSPGEIAISVAAEMVRERRFSRPGPAPGRGAGDPSTRPSGATQEGSGGDLGPQRAEERRRVPWDVLLGGGPLAQGPAEPGNFARARL